MTSLKAGLLSARSYLTILIGFLIGFAIVLWVEQQMPKRVETTEGIILSKNFPSLPQARKLTFDEAIWARVAWQYFVNNTQINGLANAEDGKPWFSLWSSGSYLLATISARQLYIITGQEFDQRIAAALTALSELPLLPGQRHQRASGGCRALVGATTGVAVALSAACFCGQRTAGALAAFRPAAGGRAAGRQFAGKPLAPAR